MTTSARNGHATSTNGHGPRIGKPYLIDPRLDPTHPIHRLAVTSSAPPDDFNLADIIDDDRDVLAGDRIVKLSGYPKLLRVVWGRIAQHDARLPIGASHAAAIRHGLEQLAQDARVAAYTQLANTARAGSGLALRDQIMLCELLGLGTPVMAFRLSYQYAAPGPALRIRCHSDIAERLAAASANLGASMSALGATCIALAFAKHATSPPEFTAWAHAQWDALCWEAQARALQLDHLIATYRAHPTP